MNVLLLSTYELGHQPLHLASPAAVLLAAGHDVRAIDLALDELDADAVAWAERIAISVPMHTAMRLAIETMKRLREWKPDTPICLFGLYAPLGRDRTVGMSADRIIAGEYEPALLRWVHGQQEEEGVVFLGRERFTLPARHLLPSLDRYAHLDAGGEQHVAGYVEASHGCIHRCAHCPIPVVYDGRIRIVGADVVIADIAQLVEMGARHITFGDPDFLNGAHHSLRVVDAMHAAFPSLTFDCTTKVSHILAQDVWDRMAEAGCLFVVSALESVNDAQLVALDKGHTVADASRAIDLLRSHGIEPRPSFLPFMPTTTVEDVRALVDFVVDHDLIGNVDSVQYSIRLLVPDGSLVLRVPEFRKAMGSYDAGALSYDWTALDPRTVDLQRELAAIAEDAADCPDTNASAFEKIYAAVYAAAGARRRHPRGALTATPRPRLTESWFCCAEPTAIQLRSLTSG